LRIFYILLIFVLIINQNLIGSKMKSLNASSYFKRMDEAIKFYKKDKYSFFCEDSVVKMQKEFKGYNMHCDIEKYIDKNSYHLCWTSNTNKNKFTMGYDIIVNKIIEKPLVYFIRIKNSRDFKHISSLKNTIYSLFIKIIGYKNVIRYLANEYCSCNVLTSNIEKGYDSLKRNTYIVRKDFYESINGFKVRNNFSIEFSSYGKVSSMHWNIFGERINKKK